MKVFNQHASILLYARAEALSQQYHNSWRCLYIRLSGVNEKRSQGLRKNFIVDAINSLLVAYEGYIYVCEDGDIAILFQGAVRPVLNRLSTHFGDITFGSLEQSSEMTFTLFDLGKDWQNFYTLCELKYLQALSGSDDSRTHVVFDRQQRPHAPA